MKRDPEFEAQFITSAAARFQVSPERLVALARERADAGGPDVRDGVPLHVEASEEAADMANYLTWRYQQILSDPPADPFVAEVVKIRLEHAVGHLAAAMAEIDHAERLRRKRWRASRVPT